MESGRPVLPGRYAADCFEDIVRWVSPTDDVRRDIVRVMVRDFCEALELRSPLTAGPRLFVSNHQMASDVVYFAVVVAGLMHQRAEILTWEGHYDLDAAQVSRWINTSPEGEARTVASTVKSRMVNRRNPRAVHELSQDIARGMASNGNTFTCLCVAGETERIEGEPMRQMGGTFLDAALAHDIPITPVRFNWGAGDRPDTRNMWPKHLARQLYVVGETITRSDLAGLSRNAQRELVTGSINALGVPRPKDHFAQALAREARIRWLADATGMGMTKAIFLDGLYQTPFADLTTEGRQVVLWSVVPTLGIFAKEDGWAYRFARWLSDGFGPARIDLSTHYPELQDLVESRGLYRNEI